MHHLALGTDKSMSSISLLETKLMLIYYTVAQHFWRYCWLTACLHKVNLVCTHLRLKVQRCWSLFKMPSYRTMNVILRQNNKTIPKTQTAATWFFMRVTLSHMISGNVAFNIASIVSSIATTLIPHLNKFTDYTKICSIGQMALEYPLHLARRINLSCLVTLSWWQVLLCLWLCCMVLAAVC